MRCLGFGVLIAFCVLPPAAADQAADMETCQNDRDDGPPIAVRIAACTRLIRSGRYKGDPLSDLYHLRGVHRYLQERYADAVADFTLAMRHGHKSRHEHRSSAYARLGRKKEALRDALITLRRNMRVGVHVDSIHFQLLRSLGYELCGGEEKPEDGLRACTEQIRSGKYRGDDLAFLHSVRAGFYHRLDKHREAISDLTAAIKLTPKDAGLYAIRSEAFRAVDRKAAILDLQKALELAPNDEDAKKWREQIKVFNSFK